MTFRKGDKPSDEVFGLTTQVDIVWDDEVVLPLNNFLVCLVRRLRAERRVSDEALEHDSTQGPPITLVSVTLLEEDFRCDVVRRSDR